MNSELLTGIASSRASPVRPSSSSSSQCSTRGSSISLEDHISSLDESLALIHDLSHYSGRPWNSAKSHLHLLEQELRYPDLQRPKTLEDGTPLMSPDVAAPLVASDVGPIGAYLRDNNRHENLLMKGAVALKSPTYTHLTDLNGKDGVEGPASTSTWRATEIGDEGHQLSSKGKAIDNTEANDLETPRTPDRASLEVGLGGTHISVCSNIEGESSDSGVSDLSPTIGRPPKRIRHSDAEEDTETQELLGILTVPYVRASDRAKQSQRKSALKPHRVRKHKQ